MPTIDPKNTPSQLNVAGYVGRLDSLHSDASQDLAIYRFTLKNNLSVEIQSRPHVLARGDAEQLVEHIAPESFDEFSSAIDRELIRSNEPCEEDQRIYEDSLGQKVLVISCPELGYSKEIDPAVVDESTALPELFELLENRNVRGLDTNKHIKAIYTKHLIDMFEYAPSLEAALDNQPKLTDDQSKNIFSALALGLKQSAQECEQRGLKIPMYIHRTNAESFARVVREKGSDFDPSHLNVILQRYLPSGFYARVSAVLKRAL